MTREEAIKTLKENYCVMCAYGSQDMDSCDIRSCDNKDAIKALEQEPCEDCISRQAAMDEIRKCRFVVDAVEKIKALPSVSTEKTGQWVKTPKAVMGEGYMWYCDKCEYQVYQDSSRPYPSEKYCPNCGVKIEVEK